MQDFRRPKGADGQKLGLELRGLFRRFLRLSWQPVFFFFTGLVPFFSDGRDVLPLTTEAIFPAAFPTIFAAVTRTPSAGSSCVSFFDIQDHFNGNDSVLRHISAEFSKMARVSQSGFDSQSIPSARDCVRHLDGIPRILHFRRILRPSKLTCTDVNAKRIAASGIPFMEPYVRYSTAGQDSRGSTRGKSSMRYTGYV